MFAFLALLAPAQARDTPERVERWRALVDWDSAGNEASEWLSAYLQIDTVAPPGNEMDGARFLERVLRSEGIRTEIVDHGDNRGSLVARIPGTTDAKPLCLLSHIDVVPSERDKWTFEPLSGEIRDGYIWGRGALDMKGMGVAELATMVWIQRLGISLDRGVTLLAVADEEVDGMGMQTLVNEHWDDIDCGYLINEGGLGVTDALVEGQTGHAISVAEKGTLWTRLIAEGPAGHGSTIEEGEAPARLLEAMALLERKYRPRPAIHPSLYELFDNAGAHAGGFTGMVLKSKLLVNLIVKPRLMRSSTTRSALTNTLHLTGMGGASNTNVVPSEVWAQYDSRLLPGTSPEELLAELEAITAELEGVRWEVTSQQAANESPWQGDPWFDTIAHYAVEDLPGSVAGPFLSVGFTDSIFVRPTGAICYGYTPFIVDEAGLDSMHGHDEKISVENMREGTRRLFSMVVDFAGADTAPDTEWIAFREQVAALPVAREAADLPAELRARRDLDQAVRKRFRPGLGPEEAHRVTRDMRAVDRANRLRMQAIVERFGWPTIPEVGREASSDAWLLVQHADADPAFQQAMLDVMAAHVDSGDVLPEHYAFLSDRVAVHTGIPQRWGTQGTCEDGTWTPHPIEHEDHVDAHRAEVGLEPLSSYAARFDCAGAPTAGTERD